MIVGTIKPVELKPCACPEGNCEGYGIDPDFQDHCGRYAARSNKVVLRACKRCPSAGDGGVNQSPHINGTDCLFKRICGRQSDLRKKRA